MDKTADEITSDLLEWLAEAAPGLEAHAPALTATVRKAGVDLRLARMTPRPGPRTAVGPLALDLDYLVTVQLADAPAEHHAVAELMFAAMALEDVEVLGGEEAARVSVAFGLPIAPGFILRVPLERARRGFHRPDRSERSRPPPPRPHPPGPIDGRVVGPADDPIDGASVEAVGLDRSVLTDRAGRFRIPDAAPEGAAVRLVVRSQGVECEAVAVAGLPVTLRLPARA